MNPDIDLEILAGVFSGAEFPETETQGEADAVGKLFETARIDAGMDAPGFADALAGESAKYTRKIAPEKTDTHRLEKRFRGSIHAGKRAHRVEKSANGHWVLEYDENDSLIRGYSIEEFAEENT